MSGDELELPERLNVAERLVRRAEDAGRLDRPLFLYGDEVVTYGECIDAARRWAAALRDLGVAREQRVLLALPDAPSFAATFLGSVWAGCVPVPLNPYLPPAAYDFYLRDSRAPAAVVAPWLAAGILEAFEGAAELGALRHLVLFDDGAEPPDGAAPTAPGPGDRAGGVAVHDGQRLLGAAEPADAAPTHRDEPAFWLYTSGSTGVPKAAVHLQHDIIVAAEMWGARTLGLEPGHVHLSASKLFFAYGLGNTLYCPMWSGGRAVLFPDKPAPEAMLDALARHAVTHFYSVPSFYGALLASPGLTGRVEAGDLSALQVCVSAGEALPAPLCRRWSERTGVPVLDGIGSTEMLHIFIANRVGDVRPGSSGRPVPGYRVRVVDEAGGDAEPGDIGDLWVAGDSCAAYYWNRHEATKRAMRGEWFVTGDKYRADEDGYFWHAGRVDDMFKCHGKWVSPPEVESVLLEHPGVLEAAVVGGRDADGLAEVVAFIVADAPRGGRDPAEQEALGEALRAHAADRMSSYCVPGRVELRDELPKTPTGKIQRFRLREEL